MMMNSRNPQQVARKIQKFSWDTNKGASSSSSSNGSEAVMQYDNINNNNNGRERLKRHREEVAGNVIIPDKWGQEAMLKDWIDCSSFEALLAPNKIASARKALLADGRRRSSPKYYLSASSKDRQQMFIN